MALNRIIDRSGCRLLNDKNTVATFPFHKRCTEECEGRHVYMHALVLSDYKNPRVGSFA